MSGLMADLTENITFFFFCFLFYTKISPIDIFLPRDNELYSSSFVSKKKMIFQLFFAFSFFELWFVQLKPCVFFPRVEAFILTCSESASLIPRLCPIFILTLFPLSHPLFFFFTCSVASRST